MSIKRTLTAVEQRGGALYGTCPEGHGDEDGEIAAEVSGGRLPYPNCPVCGSRLEETYESWERTALLETIADQARELHAHDAEVTCPCGTSLPLKEAFRCYECEVFFCPTCAPGHFGMEDS